MKNFKNDRCYMEKGSGVYEKRERLIGENSLTKISKYYVNFNNLFSNFKVNLIISGSNRWSRRLIFASLLS